MRISYDASVDAAYIRLADEIGVGGVAFTYGCDPAESDPLLVRDGWHVG